MANPQDVLQGRPEGPRGEGGIEAESLESMG